MESWDSVSLTQTRDRSGNLIALEVICVYVGTVKQRCAGLKGLCFGIAVIMGKTTPTPGR